MYVMYTSISHDDYMLCSIMYVDYSVVVVYNVVVRIMYSVNQTKATVPAIPLGGCGGLLTTLWPRIFILCHEDFHIQGKP